MPTLSEKAILSITFDGNTAGSLYSWSCVSVGACGNDRGVGGGPDKGGVTGNVGDCLSTALGKCEGGNA